MIYLRRNLIYLKQVYTFQSNQIKLQNPKPSVPFEKINCTFINNLKSKETKSKIKAHLSYLANSNFYNYKTSPSILRQHCVWRNLRNNKDIISEPDKGKGAVTLDKKLHDNAIQEIISDTSKFEKLNEGPSLKRKASLQRFLHKLKEKNFSNEIEYDKLYRSCSPLAGIYFTPKMYKFSSSVSSIISSIENFN